MSLHFTPYCYSVDHKEQKKVRNKKKKKMGRKEGGSKESERDILKSSESRLNVKKLSL